MPEITIKFPYEREKAIALVGWYLDRHGGSANLGKLMSWVFIVNSQHLLLYGRPVLGGTLYASQATIGAREFVDDLKDPAASGMPFDFTGTQIVRQGAGGYDEEKFSESDLEMMCEVEDEHGCKDSFGLSVEVRISRPYTEHHPEEGCIPVAVPYESFFHPLATSMLDLIREHQEALAVLN